MLRLITCRRTWWAARATESAPRGKRPASEGAALARKRKRIKRAWMNILRERKDEGGSGGVGGDGGRETNRGRSGVQAGGWNLGESAVASRARMWSRV